MTRKKSNDKKVKIFAAAAAALCCIWLLAGCGGGGAAQSTEESGGKEEAAGTETQTENKENTGNPADTVDTSAMDRVQINVKDYGTITLALDAEAAPATVENFEKLVKEGFYDGLTFHRIIDGFMIQGGDPLGNGTGGSDETIVGEFASNGHDNPISHVKGVISMARAQNPDSASSQFFITVADSTFLDGEYAAFGYVTEGMEVVEQIAKDAEPIDGNGTIPPEAQPVIESIVMSE